MSRRQPKFQRYVALVALAVFALVALGVSERPVVQARNDEDGGLLVQVVGVGSVTSDPDFATVGSAIEGVGETPQEARDAGDRLFESVNAAMGELGVKLIPGGYSVHPRYEYSEVRRASEIVGYSASRSLEVRVDDLTRVGDVLAALLEAGVGSIHGVTFDTTEAEELRRQAIKEAIADAAHQADAVAEAMGARVIRVEEITVDGANHGPILYASREGGSNAFEPSPVEVNSRVTVRYLLNY